MTSSRHTVEEGTLPRARNVYSVRTIDGALGLALAVTVVPYFVLRGWLTAAVVLLGMFCLSVYALGRVSVAGSLADRRVAWMLGALAAPLVAVLAVQLLRHEFVPRYIDAPLRFLMGGLIVGYFAQRRVNVLPFLQFAVPGSVFLCAAALLYPGASSHFWDGRPATYFMDPLTLAQHVNIAGFMCLFLVDAAQRDSAGIRWFKYAGFFTALTISLFTQSRTGWLMVPILAALWFVGFRRNTGKTGVALALLLIAMGSVSLYFCSDLLQSRVDKALEDVADYVNGNRDTSIGIRLSLLRANWILFLHSPATGWGFEKLPALSSIPEIAAFSTPVLQQYFTQHGGHNELMQSMMRMGVFGLVSRLGLFVVPLILFIRAARAPQPRRRTAGYLGLCIVIGYFTAGLTSEVFNLIYAASFYSLLVAVLAAMAIHEERS